ncbi:hypothetical protein GSI_09981 [Ganoderma sinense ZZ0214-1]|uniref:Uncharacterized protein n=1 Tax=Ganoderma sinense ZZ0214-1 TaxID=1077348 RepID=A0A2G8S2F4_9APHY|nr:hypothetical protein GSI_09981 [Ganoderma sinense ZZ0214-1]
MDEHEQLEDSAGLLFVLEEPVVKLDNGQQAKAILILDTARHETKIALTYKQMSLMFRDGRPVSDRQCSNPHGDVAPARTATKRPIEYVLVTDKEMKAMENARNVRKRVDELLRDLMDVASTSEEPALSSQRIYPSHPITHVTAAPVLCVDPGPRRSVVVVPQRGISAEEDQSLVDLALTNGSEILESADYMYCIELRLAPREDNPLHSDLLGPEISGRIYRACIDSSDSSLFVIVQISRFISR